MRACLFAVVLALCGVRLCAGGEEKSRVGQSLDLTTNLLTAKAGSWVRRYAPNNHVYTWHVRSVSDDGVTLQLLHMHHARVRSNLWVAIPFSYIRENAADPRSAAATDSRVEHKGRVYSTRAVTVRLHDSDGIFYISDALPATGVLCVEIRPDNGGAAYTVWNDAFGWEPDEVLLNAGPGKQGNAEYGVPLPDGEK